MPKQSDIDTLIRDLTDFQKQVKVEELLEAALAEPLPTRERLRQIEQVLETFKGLGLLDGEDPKNLHILRTLGRTYERLSHLEKAYETYGGALGLAQRQNDREVQAELLSRMGRVLSRWQRWEEALQCLDRSLAIYRELGDEGGQASTAVKRATIFVEQGDYEAANAAYEEALGLAQRVGDRKTIVAVRNNRAILATIQGNVEEAIAQYESCLSIYQELGDERGLAGAYHNLGMANADRRDWGAAMDCYERGFSVAQKNGHLDIMANVHLSMAEVLLELGNSLMVPLCCARALDIYRKTGDHLGEADTYRLLGRTFALRKEWSTAESLLRDSLRLNEEHGNPLGATEAYRDLGKLQMAQGHKEGAQASLEAALSGFRKLGARADVEQVERLIGELSGG